MLRRCHTVGKCSPASQLPLVQSSQAVENQYIHHIRRLYSDIGCSSSDPLVASYPTSSVARATWGGSIARDAQSNGAARVARYTTWAPWTTSVDLQKQSLFCAAQLQQRRTDVTRVTYNATDSIKREYIKPDDYVPPTTQLQPHAMMPQQVLPNALRPLQLPFDEEFPSRVDRSPPKPGPQPPSWRYVHDHSTHPMNAFFFMNASPLERKTMKAPPVVPRDDPRYIRKSIKRWDKFGWLKPDGGKNDGPRGVKPPRVRWKMFKARTVEELAAEVKFYWDELSVRTLAAAIRRVPDVLGDKQVDEQVLRLLRDLAVVAVDGVKTMQISDLAEVMYGFGKLGYCPAEAILQNVEQRVARQHIKGQMNSAANLSWIVWGFAELEYYPPDLMATCAKRLAEDPDMLQDAEPHVLARIAHAYQRLRHYSPDLIQALNVDVLRRIRNGGGDVRGSLLGAVANLNASQRYLDHPFLEVVARYAKEYPANVGHVNMSKLAFCFASLGVENEDLMEAMQDDSWLGELESDHVALRRMFLAQMLLSARSTEDGLVPLQSPGAVDRGPGSGPAPQEVLRADTSRLLLPKELMLRAQGLWMQHVTEYTVSDLQKQVEEVLYSLGVTAKVEALTLDKCLSMDLAIIRRDTRVAVEVDGPMHFTANPPHLPLARTCNRRLLLESRGFRVVQVPHYDWEKLPTTEERQTYLKQLLDEQGISMEEVRNPDHKSGREAAFAEPPKPWMTEEQRDKQETKKDPWQGT